MFREDNNTHRYIPNKSQHSGQDSQFILFRPSTFKFHNLRKEKYLKGNRVLVEGNYISTSTRQKFWKRSSGISVFRLC